MKGSDTGSLLLQIKSEGWGGEFVDLGDDSVIPENAVVRAVYLESQSLVTYRTHCCLWPIILYLFACAKNYVSIICSSVIPLFMPLCHAQELAAL